LGYEEQSHKGAKKEKEKTYNSEDSLVVTHPTTNSPICSLCMAERTGCPIFYSLWSYVTEGKQSEVIYRKLVVVERDVSFLGWLGKGG
jgi:hypothetical protein